MATPLGGSDVRQLGVTLTGLLSLADFEDAGRWRRKAACALRDLVRADAAFVAVDGATPASTSIDLQSSVVDAYRQHYGRVDHGIARQRTLRLEVWSRRMLWNDAELACSEYFNDFAVPNRLHYAMGVSATMPGCSVRVSLLYASPGRPTHTTGAGLRGHGARLRLLRLAQPAFRVGAMLSVQRQSRQESITDVMDRVTQPLALYSGSGVMLHENPALAHATIGGDTTVRDAIRRVAGAVAARGKRAILRPGSVCLATAEWRIVGSRIGGDEPDGTGPAVLVSLEPCTAPSPPLEVLRRRYALTARELQVLELLRERHSNAEISGLLGISAHTARHHTEHVLLKLGVTSRRRIAERYAQLGAEALEPLAPRLTAGGVLR